MDHKQSRALKLIGADKVTNSITSLGHRRNVSSIVLFYKYYFGKCSSGLSELIPPPQVFARKTRLSRRSYRSTLLRPCLTAQRITGNILHECGTAYHQTYFLIVLIFLYLKQCFPNLFELSLSFKKNITQRPLFL